LRKKLSAWEISQAAQLAIILEVSAYPKPGNVSRLHPFKDTTLDHFLAGGIAIGQTMHKAAIRGIKIGEGKLKEDGAKLGYLIEECVKASRRWHRGGNTNFGAVLLMVPLAVSAGILSVRGLLSASKLGKTVARLVREATVEDAIHLFRAVRVGGVGGLGRPPKGLPDVRSPKAVRELKLGGITLYKVLKGCSSKDSLCRELVDGLPIVLKVGYQTLTETFQETGEMNKAIIQAFLSILSKVPDSLIARKTSLEEALRVSEMASKILELGGVHTEKGWKALLEMDEKLRTPDNRFNPGATADLTAASLMVFLLLGGKP